MFEFKPDIEDVVNRFEAWWNGEILDRPPVSIAFRKPPADCVPRPQTNHATPRERWLDTAYVVAEAEARLTNTVHLGESLPIAWPNLGPEVFSAFYGCELEYSESTAWSRPILSEMSEESVDALQFSPDNVYFRKLEDMTEGLIEIGRGRFIAGYTDLHGGGDALAAFRDPQALLIDTVEKPEIIKRLCDRVTTDLLSVYDHFHARLSAAGMPSATWLPATCRGKFYVPSNDFSCMISEEMFEDLFIPGIVRECRHMDRNIYHLDGPEALRFLDRLLDIPEIHAIQWVPGAGRERWTDWLDVYRRIQARGKAFVINRVPIDDLPILFDVLQPHGVWVGSVPGVTNQDEADAVLRAVARWAG